MQNQNQMHKQQQPQQPANPPAGVGAGAMMVHAITRTVDGRTRHVADLVDAGLVVVRENVLGLSGVVVGQEIPTPMRVAYSLSDEQARLDGKGAMGRGLFDRWLDMKLGFARMSEGDETRHMIIDLAITHAAARHEIATVEDAVDEIEDVCVGAGYSRQGLDMTGVFQEVFGLIARRMFGEVGIERFTDCKKAWSYWMGYSHFRDGDGNDLRPALGHDVEAWEAGRLANPDYPKHVAAQKTADEAFRARFGVEAPTTRKGHWFRMKAYHKAFSNF